jgi:homoserine kinase
MMKVALKDRIHQPYREKLIPGMPEIIERLRKEEEVLGCVLSGAGPTLAVITEGEDIKKIEEIVHKVWYDLDIKYKIKPLTVEETGVADI